MVGVYGGVSAEDRAAARRARLLDTGLQLLGTSGWASLSVRGVCAEAKLSSRFFYESFEDLDALAVAVFDHAVGRSTAAMVAAVAAAADAGPEDQARAAIGTFVDLLEEDPRLARVLFAEALGSEALSRRRLAAMQDVARLIAGYARATYDVPVSAEPLLAVSATMLAGGITELMIAWLGGELDGVDRDAIVDDCVAVFMATAEGVAGTARARARARASARGRR